MRLSFISERGKYRKTYLAYLDILGFKAILHSKCLKNPNYLLQLFSAADGAARRDEFYGIKKLFLSDAVLMWTHHKSAIPYLIENCEHLQEQLFKKGHLVRGVIVKGDHYGGDMESINTRLNKRTTFPDHIIVSPALVKAYIMEQSLREPVIKAEGAVLNDIPKTLKTFDGAQNKRYRKEYFYVGRDYLGCFSYLMQLIQCGKCGWKSEMKREFRAVKELRNMVERNLRRSRGDVRYKWGYVGRIFNRRLTLLNKKSSDKAFFIPEIKLT